MSLLTIKKRLRNNKWKKLFYCLLAVNVAILLTLIVLIFWPIPETKIPEASDTQEESGSEFVVRTTKKNLDELANAYIEKLLSGTNHSYRISLDEDVHLLGELPVFSTTVPLSVHLVPFVQDNGDIILRQKSISVGLLELPNKKIMKYMKQYLPMPKWVTIDPKNEEIHVAVSQMDIKSNFHVTVEQFDLQANDLAFRIKVPYRTLGIDKE